MFQIGADGVDVAAIQREIEDRVARKKEAGVYDRYDLSRVAALELSGVKSEADFLEYSLKVIQQTWDLDIGDFPIYSKGGILGAPAVLLKKAIWKLHKFYTFRLWSQQNQTNALLLAAVEIMETRHRREIAGLRERIAKLEGSAQCD